MNIMHGLLIYNQVTYIALLAEINRVTFSHFRLHTHELFHLFMNHDLLIFTSIKEALNSVATAFANIVFPVP